MIESKHLMRIAFAAVCWMPLILCFGAGAEEPLPKPLPPTIAPASDDARLAIEGFAIPEGWKCELFAAEPMLANPVTFCVDPEMVDDRDAKLVHTITLSYTFYEIDMPEDHAALDRTGETEIKQN